MKILLLGMRGQLGWELRRTLPPMGQVIAVDYPDIDFSRLADLRKDVLNHDPDVIINAVAYTAVDQAEREPETARWINGTAPGMLAEVARQIGAVFLHYSTDFVFDGSKDQPYVETDSPRPINAYGESKLLGEQAVEQSGEAYLTLRTSWLYSYRRVNYMKKVLEWARTFPIMRVVTDQIGSPTSARMLSEITAQLLALGISDVYEWAKQHKGIYHLAGDGAVSRYEWAQEILRLDAHKEEHVVEKVLPAVTADFPTPAARPLNSALDCSLFYRTFGLRLPNWLQALKLMMEID